MMQRPSALLCVPATKANNTLPCYNHHRRADQTLKTYSGFCINDYKIKKGNLRVGGDNSLLTGKFSGRNDSLVHAVDAGAHAAVQQSEKKKALENVRINFYSSSGSSLAGCSIRGSCRLGPPGAAIDPRPTPREQGGVANSRNFDAFNSHTCVWAMTSPPPPPQQHTRSKLYLRRCRYKVSHTAEYMTHCVDWYITTDVSNELAAFTFWF